MTIYRHGECHVELNYKKRLDKHCNTPKPGSLSRSLELELYTKFSNQNKTKYTRRNEEQDQILQLESEESKQTPHTHNCTLKFCRLLRQHIFTFYKCLYVNTHNRYISGKDKCRLNTDFNYLQSPRENLIPQVCNKKDICMTCIEQKTSFFLNFALKNTTQVYKFSQNSSHYIVMHCNRSTHKANARHTKKNQSLFSKIKN